MSLVDISLTATDKGEVETIATVIMDAIDGWHARGDRPPLDADNLINALLEVLGIVIERDPETVGRHERCAAAIHYLGACPGIDPELLAAARERLDFAISTKARKP